MEKIIAGLKELHKLAFGDSDAFIEFFFERRFSEDRCKYIVEDGKIVSAAYWRPFTLMLLDKTVTVPFLNGVATHPDYRHKHLATTTVKTALDEFVKQGIPFAVLHPFNADFYRKLDFEAVTHAKESIVSYSPDPSVTARPLLKSDLPLISEMYQKTAYERGSWRERTQQDLEEFWFEHTQDGGSGYLIYKNGNPYSYVIVDDEKVYEYAGGLPDVLSAVKELDGKKLRILDTEGNKPYTMAAVCDIYALLSSIPYQKAAKGSFCFRYGEKTVTLSVDGGQFSGYDESGVAEFSVTPGQLVSLALGGGRRYCQNLPEAFTSLFPTYCLFFYDKY